MTNKNTQAGLKHAAMTTIADQLIHLLTARGYTTMTDQTVSAPEIVETPDPVALDRGKGEFPSS